MNEDNGVERDSITTGAIGGAVALSLKTIATFIGFLNQIILARILGAESLGEVILAISIVRVVVQIAKFGMEEATMRFVPLYINERDDAGLKGVIYFSLRFSSILSIASVFLLIILSKVISINMFHSEGLSRLLPIVVIAIPAWVVRDIIAGIIKGHKDALRALLPESLVSPLLRLATFLFLINLKDASALDAIFAFVVGEFFAMLLSIKFLSGRLKMLSPVKGRYEKREILDVAYTIIFTSMSVFLYTQADVWILGIYKSTDVVGIYGVASKLVILVYFPMLTFSALIPPLISSMYSKGDIHGLRNVVNESTRWILSMAVPLILILVLEGRFILRYLYGNEFEDGYWAMVILVAGQLIKASSGVVGYILQMTGGHKVYMKINIFCGILNIILDIILVQPLGMIGVAMATALCLSGVDIMGIFVIHKRLSIWSFARGLMFDIIFISAVSLIYVFVYYNNYIWVHLLFVISLIIYLLKSIYNNDIPLRVIYNSLKG